jgi:acyl-CoA hydrolase
MYSSDPATPKLSDATNKAQEHSLDAAVASEVAEEESSAGRDMSAGNEKLAGNDEGSATVSPTGDTEAAGLPRTDAAETKMVFPVFPGNTNHYHTLFGGTAMSWMDQAAFICGTRWCRTKVVTVHSSEIDFKHPVPEGTIVELVARVVDTGKTSLTVRVEMFIEPMDRYERTMACSGSFVLVALDQEDAPTDIPSLPA